MAVVLTEDMKAIVAVTHLCFAATVTPDGMPNLSPKGTIRVWDDSRLFYLDIASPATASNLQSNPWIEINVVDQLSRRGYRFLGRATLHHADEVYRQATRRVFEEEAAEYPVASGVLIEVTRAAPLISLGYRHVCDELHMRELWRPRRAALGRDFEQHIDSCGRFRANEQP